MKKACLALIFTVAGNLLYGQNVALINGNPINSKEFLWVYKKNHVGEHQLDYKDLAAYLELYVNFKLKVAEARAMGLDTGQAYQQEIAGYEEALKSQNKIPVNSSEYGYIMNEYREGVLMFNVCEQKIWSKAQDDEEQIKAYYAANAKKYEGKQFGEVRGQVIGDYQQQLENDWISSLRSKYKIKVIQSELKKLVKQ